MGKITIVILLFIAMLLSWGILTAAMSPAGLSDTHLTGRYKIMVTPQSDLIQLIFNQQPELTVTQDATSNTGFFCFPREVPMAISSSGTRIVATISGNGYTDSQTFYNWESRIGLPAGQGWLYGGGIGGALGTWLAGWGIGTGAGAVGGAVVGSQLEAKSFNAVATFPCLAPGIYTVTVNVYDNNDKLMMTKSFQSTVK